MNLDELERLHREASPGKWAIYLHSWHTALVTDDKSAKIYHDEIAPEVRQSTDAAYIAALHNAFPALLALARDGERYRDTSETGDYRVPHSEWKHFGNAAHFICGRWCRFHLATQVGPWLVSTVGEYVHPSRSAGSERTEIDYLLDNPLGEEIGGGRFFETMVFPAGEPCNTKECACGMPAIGGDEVDFSGYMTRKEATEGHRAMCEKYAAIDAARKGEKP